MILGRPWVEAVAELALSKARKHKVHPAFFHCLRPIVFEGVNYIGAWDEIPFTMTQADGTVREVLPADKLKEFSPTLYLWAEVYGLARELLDVTHDAQADAILSIELEKNLAALERYSTDGKKGGRGLNAALLEYLTRVAEEITEEWGQCTFSTLCAWLEENADGAETGFADCDEVEHVTEDEKPYLTWVDSRGESHRVALSSLKNTYFKKIRAALGR